MAKTMWMALAVMLPATATAQVTLVRPNVVQSIGPKQDDPLTCGPDGGGIEAIGPKQDDPRQGIIVQGGRQLAIGPKQDDPLTTGGVAFDPETDPHASGGAEAIGPKQDDPRQGIIVQGGRQLAIGPKQDDPRSPGVAEVGTYDPDTDPQALKAKLGKCGKAKL